MIFANMIVSLVVIKTSIETFPQKTRAFWSILSLYIHTSRISAIASNISLGTFNLSDEQIVSEMQGSSLI